MIALLIKASVILAILLVFYKIFLEKESFFAANRIYLLGSLVFVFLLPFVSLPQLIDEQGFISAILERTEEHAMVLTPPDAPVSENLQRDPEVHSESGVDRAQRNWAVWLLWSYYFGVVVFALNFVFQIVSVFVRIARSADKVRDLKAVIINQGTAGEPCSFFNYIFINPEGYDPDTYGQILAHETIHVRKLHSIDLLLSELAVIILWFNPLVWIFRKEVEKNIEYQTDDLMVGAKPVEKERYQMNLLRVAIYQKPLTVTTNYNQSLIRQRIMKMSAKKSNQNGYWKYAFIVPILFGVLLSINKPLSALAQNVHGVQEREEHGAYYGNDCRALLRAVRGQDVAEVQALLKTVDPDCSYRGDGEPRSPLVAAARLGDLAIGKLLVEAGADVEFHAGGDETPLIAAAWHGQLDFVKYLVDNGAMVNKKVGGDGTALLVAARDGHIETVQYLISKGADVNGQVAGDGTPLIRSVKSGHYEISRILLENGADPFLASPGDEYPMFHARQANDEAMIDLLKKY